MDQGGPWGREEPETPAARRGWRLDLPGGGGGGGGRIWLWLAGLAAIGGLVVALVHAFPEAVRTRNDWANVAYFVGLLALLSTRFLRRPGALGVRHLRYAAVWALVVAGLALVVAYRDELAGVPQHLRLAFSNGDPVQTAEHELTVPQDAEGGFVVVGAVNGQRVQFLVDTGASDTVLSPDDARRLGVDVDHLSFDGQAETANGVGRGAAFTAQRLEVGPIALNGFRMAINQAPMSRSLLGLSFLSRLESFEVRDRKLILRWREGALAASAR
ncbi:MAG TPA: TIGR02281 family clan AA aspartic protease [Phenylobacterium sp.]|nr:TIGR02281 family clan AA aspartic protease [Phenylobacterium sp.]